MPTFQLTIQVDDATIAAIARQIVASMLAQETVEPPRPDFDEAYYLKAYPDVADAVKAGYFTSGYDHYVKHGKSEGRSTRAPAGPPPVPVPLPEVPPVVVPTPAAWAPAERYPSVEAFRSDLAAHRDFAYGINLDDREAFGDDVGRFGPASSYYTQANGTVSTTKPTGYTPPVAEPARKPGDALRATYPNVKALLADAAAVGWNFALLVDGNVVKQGFEADDRASLYVTKNGRLQRA